MQSISLVIPLYNEEQNVGEGYREIVSVLDPMKRPAEIIYVDDGSKDDTVKNLLDAAAGDTRVKIIQFRRNFGQTAAMAAGLEHSKGDIVITLDGDLQNDPAEIPKMVKQLESGYDMVAGWRKHRQDAVVSRKIPSKIANWLISKFTGVKLHDYGCTLKAMTGEVARGIRLYGEMHRFIPALAAELGATIYEMPVNHRARKFGKSKYGISRTIRVLLDLLTVKFLLGYSKRPIHLFGFAGMISSGAGILILAYLMFEKFVLLIAMGNRPLMTLGVMLLMIGLQFICFGLLAEVLARTYYESQSKKIYAIRRILEPSRTGAVVNM